MASYTTRYLAQDEHDQWDELVSQSPACNIFDTTLWLDTLSSVLKCNIKILGVFKEHTLIGGVAFNVVKKFGMKIACAPPLSFYNSCHFIPKETQYRDKLGRYIQDIVTSIVVRLQDDFHYIVITNHQEFKDIRGFVWKDWDQNVVYSYGVNLNKINFSSISPPKRRQITKARKKLIATEEIKDIALVYDLIKRTYTRQGMKCPLTIDEMSRIFKKISSNIVILVAKAHKNNKYLAVYVSIADYKKNNVTGLFQGYETEDPDSGANSLLLWKAMELFKNKGFEFFDFGPAGTQTKASFKSGFCAGLFPYYRVSKSSGLKFSIVWHLTKGRILQI